MDSELQEKQRYGRNKETIINHSFINSGEYRKKFDEISDDKELNRKIYQIAKKNSKATKKMISKHKHLLTIHTHPQSMPPSIGDFNSALKNKYQISLVCCHDGKLYIYNSKKYIIEMFYKHTVAKYKKKSLSDIDAQLCALNEFQKNCDISFKEV